MKHKGMKLIIALFLILPATPIIIDEVLPTGIPHPWVSDK